MHRVWIAFGISPLVVAILLCVIGSGIGGLLILPLLLVVMYFFTAIAAIPIFFLFRKLRWLHWWQVGAAGLIIAGIFVFLYLIIANPYHIEIAGIANSSTILAVGFAVAIIFWLIGIYRNQEFSYISGRLPWGLIIVTIVIIILYGGIQRVFESRDTQGEVIQIMNTTPTKPTALVKLETGEVINARLYCVGKLTPGRKVYLESRAGFPSLKRMYWVIALITDDPNEALNSCA